MNQQGKILWFACTSSSILLLLKVQVSSQFYRGLYFSTARAIASATKNEL